MSREAVAFAVGVSAGISVYSLLRSLVDLSTAVYAAPAGPVNPALAALGEDQSTALVRRDLEAELALPREALLRITRQMVIEMRRGLFSHGQTLKMIPSYVSKRPTGKESGSYLALDLGGSNFRVCEITLAPNTSGGSGVRSRQKKFVVREDLKTGTAKELFDFFALCVEQFMLQDLGLEKADLSADPPRKLGFTFSFPVQQTSLAKGYLVSWTKGFSATGVVEQDVVALLQEAFARREININVAALVNDTVGTLVSHSYSDPQTYAGIILGTGANAAYVESTGQIQKWQGTDEDETGEMIINTEWGAFDEEHAVIPFTRYDKYLDRASRNPGRQTYEKMIGGLYLGELVRIATVGLMQSGHMFPKINLATNLLNEPYKFETAYMSRIERDHSLDLSDVNGFGLFI
ncbi:MAG: hypothetical protein SGCHY_005021 [Lobulomycetales sp.]